MPEATDCIPTSETPGKRKAEPKRQALCIGINAYPAGNALSGCINDSDDWADVLSARGYGVTFLQDEDATRQNILDAMKALVGRLNRGDVGIVTYSGHGTYVADVDGDEPDGRDEAICPVDVFSGNVITDDELFDVFNDRERGTRVALISDSCHSGTVARFAPAPVSTDCRAKVRYLPPGDFLPRKLRPLGRSLARATPLKSSALLLSGCQDFEYSYDAYINGRYNGAMTRAAIDALNFVGDGATYRQWAAELRKRLPSQEYPQSPQLVGSASQKKWKALA